MGASGSKVEDDKALQLCRERKKFVRQALDGRCSLAAAHVTYIHSLKSTGIALRKFVQPEVAVESSMYTSTSATPEPLALTEKSLSQFSFASPSRVNGVDHFSPPPSPPTAPRFHVNHMRFRGGFSKKVEEKPPVAVTGIITSSSTPQNTTAGSHERAETTPPGTPPVAPGHEDSPWDYFGLFHPIDNHLSSHQEREMSNGFENDDDLKRLREDGGMPELEDEEDKVSSDDGEGSLESEDEFDDSSPETLVRTFENLNRVESRVPPSASPTMRTAESAISENELLNGEKGSVPEGELFNGEKGSASSESELLNGKKPNSPKLSPLVAKPSASASRNNAKITLAKDDGIEHKVTPKDFFLGMKDVEDLFVKASDSGKEVPRMLEANKLHFRPIVPGRDTDGSATSVLFKACFSCGEDPSQIPEEPTHTTTKYITWHRATSSRSRSSRNPLGANSRDDIEDFTSGVFESFCMNSGSHASTLDRLYAWERKLYDEVKASQIVRRQYDMKCKLLREQESRGERPQKVDKTRAIVKDLHSRIRVAIHRIHSISKRIEELRDEELEPQLEELIEGLCRMWEVMYDCHRLQLHIISIAYSSNNVRIPVFSEMHRHFTAVLEGELGSLSSSFAKWVNAQKSYVTAIDNWLIKCVDLNRNPSSKRNRRGWRAQAESFRKTGPPIYTTCEVWLKMLESQAKVPGREVVDAIRGLAAEISRFLPRQEKNLGKKTAEGRAELDGDDGLEDWSSGYDQFKVSLALFLSQMSTFAENSAKMYGELQKSIQDAKRSYESLMSQP